jgi:phosphoribosylglycinamide formyltransferase-1
VAPIDIAVLVSGSGSNLQALIDRADGYGIAVVIADRAGIRALDRARQAGIPTHVVPWDGDRAGFTARICDVVDSYSVHLIVLAGFMRIFGPEAIRRYPGRIVNIHPSLLPSFPGADAVAQALERGVRVTGVTVHFVDEEVDHGPIISQVPVEVLAGDTVDSLHARIQEQEHRLYPAIVSALARGELGSAHPPIEVSGA